MKDSLKRAIYTWRAKNLEHVRAQNKIYNDKIHAWRKASREFLRILFTDHFPETRGRPKKQLLKE